MIFSLILLLNYYIWYVLFVHCINSAIISWKLTVMLKWKDLLRKTFATIGPLTFARYETKCENNFYSFYANYPRILSQTFIFFVSTPVTRRRHFLPLFWKFCSPVTFPAKYFILFYFIFLWGIHVRKFVKRKVKETYFIHILLIWLYF